MKDESSSTVNLTFSLSPASDNEDMDPSELEASSDSNSKTPPPAPAKSETPELETVEVEEMDPSELEGEQSQPLTREMELEAQNAELKDRLLRGVAELENLRKRSARDVAQARERGIAAFATSLLEALDNLERALNSIPEGTDSDLAQGVRMVHQQILDRMSSFEIHRINPVGKPFDPHFHEALMQEERDDVEEGTVLDELIPGYRLGDLLLRAAKVRVSKTLSSEADPS